jgi:hypothetical protein
MHRISPVIFQIPGSCPARNAVPPLKQAYVDVFDPKNSILMYSADARTNKRCNKNELKNNLSQ